MVSNILPGFDNGYKFSMLVKCKIFTVQNTTVTCIMTNKWYKIILYYKKKESVALFRIKCRRSNKITHELFVSNKIANHEKSIPRLTEPTICA